MRSLALVISIALAAPAHAGGFGFSDVGPYIGWASVGWIPRDRLAVLMGHQKDDNAQFSGFVGMRFHHVAIEAWHAPPFGDGLDVRGIDIKAMLPIGRYFSPYARLRFAHMRVQLDYYDNLREPPVSGIGGGFAIGVQAQFPGRMFGLLLPAWFAAPFGFHGTGGVFFDFGSEAYALPVGKPPGPPERFWRFAWGVAWGGAF
jgi:hypothetical protein